HGSRSGRGDRCCRPHTLHAFQEFQGCLADALPAERALEASSQPLDRMTPLRRRKQDPGDPVPEGKRNHFKGITCSLSYSCHRSRFAVPACQAGSSSLGPPSPSHPHRLFWRPGLNSVETCRVSLCRVSLCWVSLCWVSLCWVSLLHWLGVQR